jgi:hypothetical protein
MNNFITQKVSCLLFLMLFSLISCVNDNDSNNKNEEQHLNYVSRISNIENLINNTETVSLYDFQDSLRIVRISVNSSQLDETIKTKYVNQIDSLSLRLDKKISIFSENQKEIRKEIEQQQKQQNFNNEKERILGCLIDGEIEGFGTRYKFYSNGTFLMKPHYYSGTWKYIGNNKVKLIRPWISSSSIITVTKYCEIYDLH